MGRPDGRQLTKGHVEAVDVQQKPDQQADREAAGRDQGEAVGEDDELRELQRVARQHRMTTAEWVRRSLRAAREADAAADTGQKLGVIRRAAGYSFPTGDIDKMLSELK